jgi:hypothetical protein
VWGPERGGPRSTSGPTWYWWPSSVTIRIAAEPADAASLEVALDDRTGHRGLDGKLLLQVGGRHLQLVIELGTDLLAGEQADDDPEQEEDREGQAR